MAQRLTDSMGHTCTKKDNDNESNGSSRTVGDALADPLGGQRAADHSVDGGQKKLKS
jgi:hypothetical protein